MVILNPSDSTVQFETEEILKDIVYINGGVPVQKGKTIIVSPCSAAFVRI